jgi:hypothetical protein
MAMNTIFPQLVINYAEWQYILTLPESDKLQYLFDVYEAEQTKNSGFSIEGFFDAVKQTIIDQTSNSYDTEFAQYEMGDDNTSIDRVDVMIDDDNIMLESNSLKALRFVSYKFVESGYILQRDLAIEKMFRKDKVTRYLRVFRIIDHTSGLCFN